MSGALDSALHAPARLQIAAVLARVDDAEFALLKEVAGVSDSVLSKHLSALGDAGYVTISKAARDGRQRTRAALTARGRKAFSEHMKAVRDLVDAAERAVAAQ